MGMVFCCGCGKEIHETAPTCPHCGAPQAIPTAVDSTRSGGGLIATSEKQQSFAVTSLVFCVIGGIASVGAGIYLANLTAASSNNMLQAIANGVGWYCIGKGIFMMASPFQLRGAAYHFFHRS